MNYFGLFFSFFLPGLIIGMWLGMGVKETRRKTNAEVSFTTYTGCGISMKSTTAATVSTLMTG